MLELSPGDAKDYILGGGEEPLRVRDRLDLSKQNIENLPEFLECYELDLSETPIISLPKGLTVECRLRMDNCKRLTDLPEGLSVGTLSLRNCNSLHSLPEGLDTWFLDLSE